MKKLFEKKVDLTPEEICELRDEIYLNIDAVEEKEKEIEAEKAASKARTVNLQKDIGEATFKQRSNRSLLKDGYRTINVDSQEFRDGNTMKIITLEIETGDLLDVKVSGNNQNSMFDNHLVCVVADKEALVEIIAAHFTSYGEAPISTLIIEDVEYFVFREDTEDSDAENGISSSLRLMRSTYEAIPTDDSFNLTPLVIAAAQQEVSDMMERSQDNISNLFDVDESEANHYCDAR